MRLTRTISTEVEFYFKPAVLSWLADGNGDPVQFKGEPGVFDHPPVFVKTQLLKTEDEAFAIYENVMEQFPQAAFVSLHAENGESLI